MAGKKNELPLPTLDDLFSTQEMRDEENLSKIRDIPLELIDDYPDHPYKVRDDEDMQQLVESIKSRGVITPATVREKENGRYELVSGHRRKKACELAGFETLRCEVVELTKDEATILMVESNFQRSQILPSEKAFAYKMRLEAMKRQAGRPSKENLVPVGQNYSREELASQSGESQTQIQRYGITDGDGQIVIVAIAQVGNVGRGSYWSWYGFNSRVEWCACFASWCTNECGYIDTGVIPKFKGCVSGVQWFKDKGQWLDGPAEPVPGMIIFFDWNDENGQDGESDHVGIVEKVENGIVYTVEGNSGDSCRGIL